MQMCFNIAHVYSLRRKTMKTFVIILVLYQSVPFLRGDTVRHMKIVRNEKEEENVPFKNCGEETDPIQLIEFKIEPPQPIIIGKGFHFLKVTAVVNITKPIGEAGQRVSGDVSLKVKVGDQYYELCQLFKQGICHVDDFCDWLNKEHDGQTCHMVEHDLGYNCSCPVAPKLYTIENIPIPIPNVDLVIHGAFELLVALKDDVSVLGCVDMKLCVNSC